MIFDWFKKPDYSNVVKFPAPVPYIDLPTPEKDPTIFYTIGHTDDNRISIKMGHTTLTMNKLGIQHLIDQLELYKNQLRDDGDEE